jgi:hypothetical protein
MGAGLESDQQFNRSFEAACGSAARASVATKL